MKSYLALFYVHTPHTHAHTHTYTLTHTYSYTHTHTHSFRASGVLSFILGLLFPSPTHPSPSPQGATGSFLRPGLCSWAELWVSYRSLCKLPSLLPFLPPSLSVANQMNHLWTGSAVIIDSIYAVITSVSAASHDWNAHTSRIETSSNCWAQTSSPVPTTVDLSAGSTTVEVTPTFLNQAERTRGGWHRWEGCVWDKPQKSLGYKLVVVIRWLPFHCPVISLLAPPTQVEAQSSNQPNAQLHPLKSTTHCDGSSSHKVAHSAVEGMKTFANGCRWRHILTVASYPAVPAFFRLQEEKAVLRFYCKRKKLGRLGSRLS